MTPILIVTRPKAQAEVFAQTVSQAGQHPVEIVVSPLLQIVELPARCPNVGGLIFTSVNGVAQAARLGIKAGLPAWCVGERTAEAAKQAGFEAKSANGNADALISLLLSTRPSTWLAHIRGRHSRGDICPSLNDAGLHCDDVIAYDQHSVPLSLEAKAALNGNIPVILPLFSPRTAMLFSKAGPFSAPVHVVSISDAAKPSFRSATVTVARQADGDAMLCATLACISKLSTM